MFSQQIEKLPADFTFGVATSSYQIEGSSFGGCGRSHWDDFANQPGRTYRQQNGSVACDHYHLWPEDLDLVQAAGFDAYRFSFAWPRLLPNNDREVNPDGLDFYDRLIDGMLERDLQPHATLYHWDLPSRHAKKGGWTNRQTAQYLADYTDIVMRHFGDRLASVVPVNEPWCVSFLSHYWGHHAPGEKNLEAAARSMHFVQLGHGLSAQVIKSYGHKQLGCVLNKEFGVPADGSEKTAGLTSLFDGIYNRWFEESLFKGRYPSDVLTVLEPHMPVNYQDDLTVISQTLDWVGVNYYTRSVITPNESEPHFGFECIRGELKKTDMGWEIAPEGLSFFLTRIAEDYAPSLPIYITENGMANDDVVLEGKIVDTERSKYFSSHLAEIITAISNGINVKGYYAWSLLDNYEWAFGYDKRFGLVHVDFGSQKRTPKQSYYEWQQALTKR